MNLSEDIERLFKIAARTQANVLISGPTGSGKTHLARKIHEQSDRRSKPFVSVNLATLYEGTIESELFGHERGAFTGADQKRVGRLESGQGGTVFLDEIGELPPRLQARLLEFLQSRVVTPVGSNREIKLDVRVIAATHKNLFDAVKRGDFREDLFHRLRVIAVELKPLKDRRDEFDEIVHSCLSEVCASSKRLIHRISEGAARKIEEYDWPGNFRELRNVFEYAVLTSEGNEIDESDLPPWLVEKKGTEKEDSSGYRLLEVAEFPMTLNYQDSLSRFEKKYLELVLKRFRGRINQTARQIGLNKTTLIRRVRAYGLGIQVKTEGDDLSNE